MAKQKKKRRNTKLGKAGKAASNAFKSGFKYLNIPGNLKLYREEPETVAKLDIIPYIVQNVKKHPESTHISDDLWYRYPFYLHNNVGPDRQKIICPKTVGKPCPVCEEMQTIYNDPTGDNKIAGTLRASLRWLYIVIPKNHKKYKEEPHIWNISHHCFQEKFQYELDLGDGDNEDYMSLEEGKTLKIRFIEKSIVNKSGTSKFAFTDRVDFTDRDDYDEDILDDLPDLADCVPIPTYDRVSDVFNGIDEEEDDTPEEKPKKEKKVEKKKAEKKEKPKAKPKKEKKEKVLVCPHECDFGTDYDEYECCTDDDCALMKECKKASKGSVKEEPEEDTDIDVPDDACPDGHVFGKDLDKHPECDDCGKWEDCAEAN